MILTLALRNLLHDRIRLFVTSAGIFFAVVLVAVQLGLYLGAARMITAHIDHANADLWIMTKDAQSFEDGSLTPLPPRHRAKALATPGVKAAIPLVVAFSEWQSPAGEMSRVFVIGTDPGEDGFAPWSIFKGRWDDLIAPGAIAVDDTYLGQLGIGGIGGVAQINRNRVTVAALTDGVRSFTQAPYVYAPTERARRLAGVSEGEAAYFLVQLEPEASLPAVRSALNARLGDDAEALTTAEFRERSLDQWLFRTGAGMALIGGALLGLIVGTVIVGQTLYSSTKDHIHEFATLRALGSSSGYINRVILVQAMVNAIIGYSFGLAVAVVIGAASRTSPLPILISPGLAAGLLVLTLGMCALSALSAIGKVMRIDPAMVFNR